MAPRSSAQRPNRAKRARRAMPKSASSGTGRAPSSRRRDERPPRAFRRRCERRCRPTFETPTRQLIGPLDPLRVRLQAPCSSDRSCPRAPAFPLRGLQSVSEDRPCCPPRRRCSRARCTTGPARLIGDWPEGRVLDILLYKARTGRCFAARPDGGGAALAAYRKQKAVLAKTHEQLVIVSRGGIAAAPSGRSSRCAGGLVLGARVGVRLGAFRGTATGRGGDAGFAGGGGLRPHFLPLRLCGARRSREARVHPSASPRSRAVGGVL